WRRSVNLDLGGQFQLSRAPQSLSQNRALDRQLVLVRSMLIMAPSARSEIRTRRHHPLRRCLDHLCSVRPDESSLLLKNGSFDFFSSQNERKKGGLAPAALVCGQ